MNKKLAIIIGVISIVLILIYILLQSVFAPEKFTGDILITHELGETEVKKNPKNVVVFDFGVLDILDSLEVGILALPQSSTVPSFLSKYKENKYHNVGTLQEPNFEKIYELKPDLIIISTRQQALYSEFQKIAPTIYLAINNNDYINSFKENANIIGKIFEKENVVLNRIEKIEEEISKVSEMASRTNDRALILLLNNNTISAYGFVSRFGLIHNELGVKASDKNIVASTHGQNVNFEYIQSKNPDIIFTIDRGQVVSGGTPSAGLLNNEMVNTTNAAKNGKIINLDPEVWYLATGGFISTEKMIKEIQAALELTT